MAENSSRAVITLEAEATKFMAQMRQAESQFERSMGKMKQDAVALGVAMGALGLAGATALTMMVKDSIDAADKLRDMSQKVGIAVDTLNGLGFAASLAGGNLDSVGAAAGKLNKSIAEAAGGNEKVGEAFKALGISVLDAEGNLKKADVVMAEVADQFQKFEDGPEKSAFALRLFGKAGADMIPLLNEGGAAMRANIEYAKRYSGVTQELANASDNFNDTMAKLQIQQQGFKNTVTAAVLPVLQVMADEFLKSKEKADGFTEAGRLLQAGLKDLVVGGAEVVGMFSRVGNTIGGAAAMAVAFAKGDMKAVDDIRGMVSADNDKSLADQEAFAEKIRAATATPAKFGGMNADEMDSWGIKKRKKRAPRLGGEDNDTAPKGKDPDADFRAYLKQLNHQIAKVNELTVSEKLLADIKNGALTVSGGQQAQLGAIAREIDLVKEASRVSEARAAQRRKDEQDSLAAIRQIEDEKAQQTARNAANAEQIQISLLDQTSQEVRAYGLRMQELKKFHDDKLENVRLANELMEAETARHEQARVDMTNSKNQELLGLMSGSTGELLGVLKQAGLEQTALGKAAYLADKALAIATIIVNTEVAAAKALAVNPIYGPILATTIRVLGYASAGIVAGTAIASAEGGYDIPAGVNPVTQLHEREMVLPKEQADVVRNMARSGSSAGSMPNITLINNGTPQRVAETRRISDDEYALMMEDASNLAVSKISAQLGDPNSRPSRAMSRNFATPRSR